MRTRVITGVTGDVPFPSCFLDRVRVAGTAALAGAVQIKRGAAVLETIPAGATPGTQRVYGASRAGHFAGTKFDNNSGVLTINMANAGDTVNVLFE